MMPAARDLMHQLASAVAGAVAGWARPVSSRRWAEVIPGLALVIAFSGFAGGCPREVATQALCAEVLDRIIQIELTEQGFRDPVLVARKQGELRRLLAPQLTACVDRQLPAGALECVRRARTTEEISHACLR